MVELLNPPISKFALHPKLAVIGLGKVIIVSASKVTPLHAGANGYDALTNACVLLNDALNRVGVGQGAIVVVVVVVGAPVVVVVVVVGENV
jgi:hypothetical protein